MSTTCFRCGAEGNGEDCCFGARLEAETAELRRAWQEFLGELRKLFSTD